MKPSLRANLTWTMTALFTTALVVIGLVAYLSARSTVSGLSDEIIRQASNSIEDRIQGLLDKSENSGQFLKGLVAPSTFPDPTSTNSSSFRSNASKMLELVSANREYSSVSFTLDRTGETVKVVQRSNGELMAQLSLIGAGDQRIRQDLVPFGSQLQIRDQVDQWTVDLREMSWYSVAKSQARPFWTETYLISNGTDFSTPGVTYALPVYSRQNIFMGVVTIDITISDLSRFIDRIEVGKYGYATLLEFDSKQAVKVVAHPQKNRLLISEKGRDRLATLQELGDPVMSSLATSLGGLRQSENEPQRQVVKTQVRDYQVGVRKIVGERRPEWYLAVVIPDDEFMEGVWRTSGFLAVIGIVAVISVWGLSYAISQRVARPLQELAVETKKVQSLDLAPRTTINSHVREIDELARAMEQMKTGLRSLEKLVPGDYARYLISSGQEAKLGGDRRHITTYFADIIGFTALSERMEPEELVDVLAEYLDVLSGEVLKLGGTVDKFNGDDVMAFWGAPNPSENHAFLACRAAISSQVTLEHLHTEWRENDRPLLRASFGISTGDVIVGNVGSRQRMNYTVIGDAVNLASRLQGLNKHYSTEILLSEQTVTEAGSAIVSRLVDWVSVAGRDEPVPVFELLGLSESMDEERDVVANIHNESMALYRQRQFHEAMVKFSKILELRPHDGPARILLARCEHFLTDPPAEAWSGAVQLNVK